MNRTPHQEPRKNKRQSEWCHDLHARDKTQLGNATEEARIEKKVASVYVRSNVHHKDTWPAVESLHPPVSPSFQMRNPYRWQQATPTSRLPGLFALPLPTTPLIASVAYFSTTSGGWSMANSVVLSSPVKVRIANSPPGCRDKKSQHHPHIIFLVVFHHFFHGAASF